MFKPPCDKCSALGRSGGLVVSVLAVLLRWSEFESCFSLHFKCEKLFQTSDKEAEVFQPIFNYH